MRAGQRERKALTNAIAEISAVAMAHALIPPIRRACVSNTCNPTVQSANVAPMVSLAASGGPRRELASRRRRSSEAMRNCRVPLVTCSR